MKILALKLVAILFFTGCTNKDVYNNIQNNGKRECEKESPTQYDQCVAQYSVSFEDYKDSRDKLLKGSEKSSQ